MANVNNTISFKKIQISYEDDTIVEYQKDAILTYKLSEVLEQFKGEGRFFDLTLKEVTELEPSEEE